MPAKTNHKLATECHVYFKILRVKRLTSMSLSKVYVIKIQKWSVMPTYPSVYDIDKPTCKKNVIIKPQNKHNEIVVIMSTLKNRSQPSWLTEIASQVKIHPQEYTV